MALDMSRFSILGSCETVFGLEGHDIVSYSRTFARDLPI